MDSKEQEAALEDVDRKIERLRASYDQYFMGLERVAPSDARRDVDRRIRVLRNENIRNTATKYRFQQLVQRFVTYTGYWDRITRQIEEGTFKRDVDRAKQRVGKAPAKPRVAELELDFDVEVDIGGEDDMDAAINRAIRDAEEEEERLSLTPMAPEPPPAIAPAAASVPRVPPPVPRDAGIRAAVFTEEDFAAIDSAFDGMIHPSIAPPARASPAAAPSTGTHVRPTVDAPVAATASGSIKDTTARKPSARFARPKELETAGLAPPAVVSAPPVVSAPAPSAAASKPATVASPPSGAARLRAASLLDEDDAREGPSTDKRPALSDAVTPQSTPAARVGVDAAAAPRSPVIQANPAIVRAPAVARPAPPAVKPAASPPVAAKPAGSSVDDETKRLYARYVEMRRACNEPTENVRIESLARNMAEIRKKHGGRDIDFEVVVKDGRAAIKPVKR